MDQLKAVGKWLASFKSSSWSVADYPVRVLERRVPSATGRRKPLPWTAQVINWWHMRGDGFTREEALERLRERFESYRANHQLPRPGLGAPFEFKTAAQDVVRQHEGMVRDLLQRVIGLNPDECLVTDESSLWDFHDEETNAEYFRKISLLYEVDVSDVNPPTLAAIAVRLDERRGA